MDSIRIQNLKCLADTSDIALKPLTLLVGANSSGKSTFLRVFPLFKQSLGVRTRGPVLWYGNEVDFGSFSVAKKRGADAIRFSFSYSKETYHPPFFSLFSDNPYKVSFTIKGHGDIDYIDSLEILFVDSIRIAFFFNSTYSEVKFYINDRDYSNDKVFRIRAIESFGVFPNIVLSPRVTTDKNQPVERQILLRISSLLTDCFGMAFDSSIIMEKLRRSTLDLSSIASFQKSIEELFGLPKDSKSSTWSMEKSSELLDNIIIYAIEDLCSMLNFTLREDFESVSYIKPIRAYAERYYRVQNLAVRELDSDGHNMAMFLHEILKNKKQKESFQEWTEKYFKFTVDTQENEGHISVILKDKADKNPDNIADMGFGYSQILPILIVLWKNSVKSTSTRYYSCHTITIEQPELHLHPLMQARFADALMNTIRIAEEHHFPIRFIIETHSKVIINRIGVRIAERMFKEDDSVIYLFEEDYHSSTASVRSATYSKDGILNDWPIGFFDPVVSDDVL